MKHTKAFELNEIQQDGYGVVFLDVTVDTYINISRVIAIVQSEHSRFNAYKAVNDEITDSIGLELSWEYDFSLFEKLPYELDLTDTITDFILNWLSQNGKYPDHVPNTDGHYKKGFHVTSNWKHNLLIMPTYTVYGK